MRVLIISLPRTGSNSLMKQYSKKYNLKIFGEPYNEINKNIWSEMELEQDNIVVKTIIHQTPNSELNHIEFWISESKKYDKVILLSRKNLTKCAESVAFLSYNEKNGFKYNKKYNWYLTPNLNESMIYVEKCDKDLKILSNFLNIDIIYYEDIFDLNSKDRLRNINVKPNKLL
jgi:hypothetical protein